jgi:uncharacterized OB-fold protein
VTDALLLPPQPVADPDTIGFWDALRAGRFSICRCVDCGLWMHPPLERCRSCNGAVRFDPVSGRGHIVTFIVVRQPTVPGHDPPYVVATVELVEQEFLRVVAVVAAEPEQVHVGDAVQANIVPLPGSDFRVPEFVLAVS